MDPIVRTVDLVKDYDGGRVRALAGVTMEVRRGEFVSVQGPSGSGKTTLLNLIGAMDRPTSGEVHLNGAALSVERDLDRVRASSVGFIFQMHNLIPVLSARQNVEVAMVPLGVPRRERVRRALELIDQVGLTERAGQVITKLSGGERQRVAIARALANRPPVILADEPTGNLDSRTGGAVMAAIHEARARSGAALILVTHNPEICAGADRRLWMRDGTIRDLKEAEWEAREPSLPPRGA